MNESDLVAEKFQELDGQALVDYLPVALPCYLLQVEALVIERRRLMPVEEFVLRALHAGLRGLPEVSGILGLSARYSNILLKQLDDDEYVSLSQDGSVRIRPKGAEALRAEGEKRPCERSVNVVWDPVLETPLTSWIDLIGPADIRSEDRVAIVPDRLQPPNPEQIPVSDLQRPNEDVGASDRERALEEIIRFLEVRRRTLRYRRAVVLAYLAGEDRPPIIKIAMDGRIDEGYTQAFARKNLGVAVGVDSQFHRRSGVSVVRQHLQALGNSNDAAGNYGELIKRRSVTRLSLDSLTARAEVDSSDEIRVRIRDRRQELDSVEALLSSWPIRQIRPFEVPQVVAHVLQTAKTRILFTTTMPVASRLHRGTLDLLEAALVRGVKVSVYIAGRIEVHDATKPKRAWNPAAELSRLVDAHRGLQVEFLKDVNRRAFEILVDGTHLIFANEPPFGLRAKNSLLRRFVGYSITDRAHIRSYIDHYLSPSKLEVLDRLRPRRAQPPRIASMRRIQQ